MAVLRLTFDHVMLTFDHETLALCHLTLTLLALDQYRFGTFQNFLAFFHPHQPKEVGSLWVGEALRLTATFDHVTLYLARLDQFQH